MTTRAICTIVSKNYLAHARTLARSLREIDADAKVFVCLVDLFAGAIDPASEPFELIRRERSASRISMRWHSATT